MTADRLPPTDEQLWWSVRETVRAVLLPQLDDPWARSAAIQLIGLADFGRGGGGADRLTARIAELAAAMRDQGWTDIEPSDPGVVLAQVSAYLVENLGYASEGRDAVRAVLVHHLSTELGRTSPLIGSFRGLLPTDVEVAHTPAFIDRVVRDDSDGTGGEFAPGPAAAVLARWLSEQFGRTVEVVAVARLAEGHSRAMFTVTLDGGERLVLRQEQGGVFGTSSQEEFRVMSGLHAVGYPVAEPLAAEPTGTLLGQPFFVMRYLEADRSANPDERTGRDFIHTIHRLHELDWEAAGLQFDIVPASAADATPGQVRRWRDVYRGASTLPDPLLEEAAEWLIRSAPPLDRLCVVHGDAGPGNFVHRAGEVVAVTDFEFCHLGDPAEDWAFCATMRGHRTMERDAWIAAYRDELGVELPQETWDYWEAFNLFKGACANATARRVFADGTNPAPNMLIVGTALAQVFERRLVDLVRSAEPPVRR